MSDLELLLELLENDEHDQIAEVFKATDPNTRGVFMAMLDSRLSELEEPVN